MQVRSRWSAYSIVDVICGVSDNYNYWTGTRLGDLSWQSRAWNGFNNEQQASIVNEWFAAHLTDLNSFAALNDPSYRFIRDNIRGGRQLRAAAYLFASLICAVSWSM
jgi:hypothetical protein